MFIVLLASIVNASNHTKSVSLSNQKFKIQPSLINLHPNEQNEELQYYPLAVKLDRCVGNCNTLNQLTNKICTPNKTDYLNIIECQCECKKHYVCKTDYVWNPAACNYEVEKYLASIMDDQAITCDENIGSYHENTGTKSYNKTKF